jgi:hypothetical protein
MTCQAARRQAASASPACSRGLILSPIGNRYRARGNRYRATADPSHASGVHQAGYQARHATQKGRRWWRNRPRIVWFASQ